MNTAIVIPVINSGGGPLTTNEIFQVIIWTIFSILLLFAILVILTKDWEKEKKWN